MVLSFVFKNLCLSVFRLKRQKKVVKFFKKITASYFNHLYLFVFILKNNIYPNGCQFYGRPDFL